MLDCSPIANLTTRLGRLRWQVRWSLMRGPARMVATHWSVCCGSQCSVVWLAMEDVNDAERLRHDPAMRWVVGGKAAQGCAASPSQMGRFETRWLATEVNLSALTDLSGHWIDLVHNRRPPRGIVLDMDSSVSPTHGEQEMSIWNGHYKSTCYHPLFVFNQF